MDPKSARSLAWFALIVNCLGAVVLTLGGQFFFSAFAALLVLAPAIFARKGSQAFAAAVLALSLALAWYGYSDYREGMAKYRERAVEKAKR